MKWTGIWVVLVIALIVSANLSERRSTEVHPQSYQRIGFQTYSDPSIPLQITSLPILPLIDEYQLSILETTPESLPEPTIVKAAGSQTDPVKPISAPNVRVYSHEEILAEIHKYSCASAQYEPCWDQDEAILTFTCESGLSQFARSPVGAIGISQLHPEDPAAYDVAINIARAHAKYRDGVRIGNRWYHWNNWGSCGHYY
jgi:hypothetical protein